MSANLIAQLNVKTQGVVDKSVAYCRPEVTPTLPVMRNVKFNSSQIAATLMRAGVTLLIVVAASMAGWAQCPNPPTYSPDFSNVPNQACLILNGAQQGTPTTAFPTFAPAVSTTATVLRLTPTTWSAAGSAWYNALQPVAGGFSTTFTFQLSDTTTYNADGFAFVIQNSTAGTSALGPYGCGIGFGESNYCTAQPPPDGITNSLAVEFNTYQNANVDPSNSDVTIQNCSGTGANSVDPTCQIAVFDLTTLTPAIIMADGNIHTVTISYTPTPTASASPNCIVGGIPKPCLDVILDGHDLFSGGVVFDLTTIGLTSSGTAYVGFTAATGGGNDNQDILSWVFTPQSQSQTQPVTPTSPANYNFNGGCTGSNCSGYSNTVAENPGSTLTINNLVATVIPIVAGDGTSAQANQAACNSIVDALNPNTNPPSSPFVNPDGTPPQTAQCFVYQNATQNGNGQSIDAPVMFAVSCPPSGICDTTESQFFAAMSSYFGFTCAENPPLIAPDCSPVNSPSSFGNFGNLTTMTGLPSIGFLQGAGPDPNNPCNPATGSNAPPLFQSNQIVSYTLGDTSSKPVKGGSTTMTSCWVATYETPGEMPKATISGPTNGAIYQQGAVVPASYTCTAVSTDPDSIMDPNGYPGAGPYLTVGICNATSGLTAGGGTPTSSSCTPSSPILNSCSGTINIDTSETGPHTVTVDAEDSATNTAQQQVTYNVIGATDVAIANIASPITTPGSKLTYVIGVGDLGSVNALNTVVNDTLATGTTFVSASGSNIACSIVGKKLTCPSTPISCTSSGSNVSCDVGTIMPLSLSDLNGAVISITVKVTATGTIKNPTLLSNTATVSESNTDTKPSNNTATAKTNVE